MEEEGGSQVPLLRYVYEDLGVVLSHNQDHGVDARRDGAAENQVVGMKVVAVDMVGAEARHHLGEEEELGDAAMDSTTIQNLSLFADAFVRVAHCP
jgi:hypothetical protein